MDLALNNLQRLICYKNQTTVTVFMWNYNYIQRIIIIISWNHIIIWNTWNYISLATVVEGDLEAPFLNSYYTEV